MEVVVISRDTIKPSNPTPHHLRHFSLSFLDQILTTSIIPLIFYYHPIFPIAEATNRTTRISNHLKKSLSETLTKLYPLAGRLKQEEDDHHHHHYVDCNDDGVPYSEAQANCRLSQIVENPNDHHGDLNKLLPCNRLDDAGDLLLAVRVTVFECGGMAIGVCFSHKISDGISASTFVNSWAASARAPDDDNEYLSPRLDSAAHFPPREVSGFKMFPGLTKENVVAKVFVFSPTAISALKEKYAAGANKVLRPTRVEALTTFVWSRFVAVTKAEAEAEVKKIYLVSHAVNLRTRMNPPLPDTHYGNFSWFVLTSPSMDDKPLEEGYGLVTQLREAVGKIDSEYVNQIQEGDTFLNAAKKIQKGDIFVNAAKGPSPKEITLEFVAFSFSSFCRFPLYEVDFGWGKPLWVSMASEPFYNKAYMMPSRSGDEGIEVWINLVEDDMAKLEADGEFLKYVSL